MRYIISILSFCLLSVLSCHAQFDMGQEVSESGYGLVKTNMTFSYDHTFNSVPDNLRGRVSYQFVKKQWLKISANTQLSTLWANFDESQLSKPYEPTDINLNGQHLFGTIGFTALGFLPFMGHPVALIAIGSAEFSTHCFGRVSGLAGASYMLKMSKDTQFGIGPVFLINTASKVPVLPAVFYRHRFDSRLAINIYGGIFGLEYNPTLDDLFVLGADLDVRSFYFKPGIADFPDKCRFTMSALRPGIKYKRRLATNFYATFSTGVSFKISGKITEATNFHTYLKFRERPAFFLLGSVSYSL